MYFFFHLNFCSFGKHSVPCRANRASSKATKIISYEAPNATLINQTKSIFCDAPGNPKIKNRVPVGKNKLPLRFTTLQNKQPLGRALLEGCLLKQTILYQHDPLRWSPELAFGEAFVSMKSWLTYKKSKYVTPDFRSHTVNYVEPTQTLKWGSKWSWRKAFPNYPFCLFRGIFIAASVPLHHTAT